MTTTRLLIAGLLPLLATGPALAGTSEGALRVYAAWVNPQGDLRIDDGFGGLDPGISASVEADSAVGLGAAYEIGLSPRWGIETDLSATELTFDVEAEGATVELGKAWMIPLVVAVHYHFTPKARADVYAGPVFGYTLWGTLDGPFGSISLDPDFGFGLQVGVDLPFSGESGWSGCASLRYFTAAAGDASATIDVDPLTLRVGIGYRF